MYAILAALISSISAVGSGAQDTTLARIKAEGATSRSLIEEGKQFGLSGWETIGQVFNQQDILAQGIGSSAVAKGEIARLKAQKEREFQRALLFIGLGAAVLLIVFLFLKSK